jgi:glucose-6-phosphate-specific signal transduction histidine kinase
VNAAPPRDTVAIVPPDDGGFGLTGMRERVAALGGTIDHGPLPSGGFRVRVTLPCHPGTTTLRPQADRGTR